MITFRRMREIHIGETYYARDDGTIYSTYGKGRVLKPGIGTNGRPHVNLVLDGKRHTLSVHVLICEAFHGPRPEGMTVSHLDGNILNNKPSNLAWETWSDNHHRKIEHGTDDRGFHNTRAVMTPATVRLVHKRKAAGWTDQRIADSLGVSRTTIVRVKKGQRYA